jgi:hypothetical protein
MITVKNLPAQIVVVRPSSKPELVTLFRHLDGFAVYAFQVDSSNAFALAVALSLPVFFSRPDVIRLDVLGQQVEFDLDFSFMCYPFS